MSARQSDYVLVPSPEHSAMVALKRIEGAADEVLEVWSDHIGTHYDECWKRHVGCFASLVKTLSKEASS